MMETIWDLFLEAIELEALDETAFLIMRADESGAVYDKSDGKRRLITSFDEHAELFEFLEDIIEGAYDAEDEEEDAELDEEMEEIDEEIDELEGDDDDD